MDLIFAGLVIAFHRCTQNTSLKKDMNFVLIIWQIFGTSCLNYKPNLLVNHFSSFQVLYTSSYQLIGDVGVLFPRSILKSGDLLLLKAEKMPGKKRKECYKNRDVYHSLHLAYFLHI